MQAGLTFAQPGRNWVQQLAPTISAPFASQRLDRPQLGVIKSGQAPTRRGVDGCWAGAGRCWRGSCQRPLLVLCSQIWRTIRSVIHLVPEQSSREKSSKQTMKWQCKENLGGSLPQTGASDQLLLHAAGEDSQQALVTLSGDAHVGALHQLAVQIPARLPGAALPARLRMA